MESATVPGPGRRGFELSKGWIQAVLLVVLTGFFILGLLAYRTYMAKPPVPRLALDAQGHALYTGKDVQRGQEVFLHNGLMEYGSAFGHGAYLGPDFTADYLRRSSDLVKRSFGGDASPGAARRTVEELRTNRYDKASGTLRLTAPQAEAFRRLVGYYGRYFSDPNSDHGLRPDAIVDPTQLRQLTSFFAWTAWAASTRRPGHSYSYTNNWPPEPRVDNKPTADVVVWSVLSLIALLGGIGLLFTAFGRWRFLGWHGREQASLSFALPVTWRSLRLSVRRPGSSSSWLRCSCCRPSSAPRRSTTGRRSRASSASTSRGSFPTTCCAPGTCSSRCSG